MTLTRAAYLAYMKERWVDPDDIMLAIVANSPVLGMFERQAQRVGGKYMHLPQLRVGPQGRSATYQTADDEAQGSQTVGFNVEYLSNYQIIKLEGDTVDDCAGDENAIHEAIDHETKGALANMRKDLQHQLFGSGGGSRGRVGSITTGLAGANCRIVLETTTDAKFFEEGMVIVGSANDGTASGHTLRDSGNSARITGVNKMLGYLEFAAAVNTTISGLTTSDHLFAKGDFKLKWSGMLGWVPRSDPTSGDSFHGVDRSPAPNLLGGLRFDASGQPIETAIVEAMGWADLLDCHPDIFVVNPIRHSRFANSLGADRANRITSVNGVGGGKSKAVVSYSAIMVATSFGDVPVVADGGCDLRDGLGLTKDTWRIGYSGEDMVHWIDDDGSPLRRGQGDTWRSELKSRGNLGCTNPGLNIRLDFGT